MKEPGEEINNLSIDVTMPNSKTQQSITDSPFAEEIPELYKRHFDSHIKGSGISLEVALERGYRTIQGRNELEKLGFGKSQRITPGLLLPVITPDGKRPFWCYDW